MNPVIVSIGGFDLKWYAVILLASVLIGLTLIQKEAKKFKIKEDFTFNMGFWAIIFGLIGARVYYVIFSFDYFKDHLMEIIKVWNGGLAIHGGLIGGALFIIVYCKKYNVRLIRYIDFCIIPLLLGQAIGRWGNFFNNEAHGAATTVAHLKTLLVPNFIIEGMKIDGVYYTPTFFFESIICLLIVIVLLFVRRGKYTKVGTITALYLLGYGVLRFFIEMDRTDALMMSGFKVAQIISIGMIIISIIILSINVRKSKFEDLYNDKNNIDQVLF